MKLDRIIWGMLLLFVGGVLLLDNFDVIEFYWSNIWGFWPVLLIILGVNILFNRNNSQTGNMISIGILVITLSVLFVKGQQEPRKNSWFDRKSFHYESDSEGENIGRSLYAEPLTPEDERENAVLNIKGGAHEYTLDGETDSLFLADVSKHAKGMRFMLNRETNDMANVLTFRMDGKSKNFNFGDDQNEVHFKMNAKPIWEINFFVGAGSVDFDLEKYKISKIYFKGGASDVSIKFGANVPQTEVSMEVGVANVELQVPKNAGCRIKTKMGLSAKDFEGFQEVGDGIYETSNYKSTSNKILINLDGGLSNFEVTRY